MITEIDYREINAGGVIRDSSGHDWIVKEVEDGKIPHGVIGVCQLQKAGDPRTLRFVIAKLGNHVSFSEDGLTTNVELSGMSSLVVKRTANDTGRSP